MVGGRQGGFTWAPRSARPASSMPEPATPSARRFPFVVAQVNVQLSRSLVAKGKVDVRLTMYGKKGLNLHYSNRNRFALRKKYCA